MKKTLFALLFAGLTPCALAGETVLLTATVHTGGRDVPLMLLKLDDGTVCQEYVSQVGRYLGHPSNEPLVTLSIARVCDIPVGEGAALHPKKLKALRWTALNADDGIHIPELDN